MHSALVEGGWSNAKSRAVSVSPGGEFLLRTTAEEVAIYKLGDGKPLASLKEKADMAAVSTTGDRIAVVRGDGSVVIRPTRGDGKEVSLQGLTGKPVSLQFDPRGRWLITLGPDTAVRLFDPATGLEFARFGFPERPTSLTVSVDGRLLGVTVPEAGGGTRAIVRQLGP
jgi:hypothetical protein